MRTVHSGDSSGARSDHREPGPKLASSSGTRWEGRAVTSASSTGMPSAASTHPRIQVSPTSMWKARERGQTSSVRRVRIPSAACRMVSSYGPGARSPKANRPSASARVRMGARHPWSKGRRSSTARSSFKSAPAKAWRPKRSTPFAAKRPSVGSERRSRSFSTGVSVRQCTSELSGGPSRGSSCGANECRPGTRGPNSTSPWEFTSALDGAEPGPPSRCRTRTGKTRPLPAGPSAPAVTQALRPREGVASGGSGSSSSQPRSSSPPRATEWPSDHSVR